MKAATVMYAAQKAFSFANANKNYWEGKTNNFLRRCGAVLEKGPEQELDDDRVQSVVFAMLDDQTESVFLEGCK
jgi:hypothetical protein